MLENSFRSVVHIEIPGDIFVAIVVEQTNEEVRIDYQVPEGIPPAAGALVLAQVLSAILPAGHTGFHAWKTYSVLRQEFEYVNRQMANVPTESGDELPF